MQSIAARLSSSADTDEGDFGPGMTLVAHLNGPNWLRGTKGVICARRVAEMLPALGGVTMYVVLFETGLMSEMTVFELRRYFFVGLGRHPGFDGYVFKGTRDLFVDFRNGRFSSIFLRRDR